MVGTQGRQAIGFTLAASLAVAGATFAAPASKAPGAPSASVGSAAAPEEAADEPPPLPASYKPGPQAVQLGHGLKLDVPEPHLFIGMPEAGKMMESNGSFHNEDLLGLVIPKIEEPGDGWFVVIRYEASGHVADDEAIDADELLAAMKEGQEEANQERRQRGFPALELHGWQEPPTYVRGKHHLVWGLNLSSVEGNTLNYNTRVLGRTGFASLNLVLDPADFQRYRPEAVRLLEATHFESGSRYEDFVSGQDQAAEYGLTGLIVGGLGMGAAKAAKAGLLAKLGLLLVKGWKIVAVAAVAAIAAFRSRLSRRSEE